MIQVKLLKVNIPPTGIHLLVEVEINSIPSCFVLDTGASRSVIDIEYLKSITEDIKIEEESSFSAGVGGADLKSFTAELDSFKIGEFELSSYEIAVMDLHHVRQSYEEIGERPIYGVIGGEVLLEYNAIIDYNELVLKLNSPVAD